METSAAALPANSTWNRRASRILDRRPTPASRLLLVAAALLLVPGLWFPLWNMTFYSNQFPDGLELHIYAHKLEGGQTPNRDDLREINSLNHYIGMRPLLESDFSEFNWIPLATGAFILLTLRAAILGKVATMVDLVVAFGYFGLFSLWSFYHRLYQYGHNLDPQASVKVPPFTPPLFGSKQMANFTVYSLPGPMAYLLFGFGLLLLAALVLTWRSRESVQ